MLRPIVKHGNVTLHQPAELVEHLTSDIQSLIDDMIESMYAAQGIGLAAPQIGVGLRIFVIDLSGGEQSSEVCVVINPRVIEYDGTQLEEEGCLSLPGFTATVTRPSRILVAGLDRHGKELQIEGRDLLARALQHEIDHLDGRLFIDRLKGIKRSLIIRRLDKLKRQDQW